MLKSVVCILYNATDHITLYYCPQYQQRIVYLKYIEENNIFYLRKILMFHKNFCLILPNYEISNFYIDFWLHKLNLAVKRPCQE